MKIAKAAIDVGLHTVNKDPMLAFWQQQVGLPFHETLPVGRGVHQLRHGIGESILKINHNRDALPTAPPTGYRSLTIARSELAAPRELTDPDGNRITLVPSGHQGIEQLQVNVAVRDIEAQRDFYRRVLELEETDDDRFRCGASLLALVGDTNAAPDAQMRGIGYRYLTIQVFDVVAEHRGILERGGHEGSPPVRLGDVAYISFVRDPDGNWIEISQRKSITGSLD
jgi:catechol 2,3-dioxygenase-like lactoylglutathione lyase family enzyme